MTARPSYKFYFWLFEGEALVHYFKNQILKCVLDFSPVGQFIFQSREERKCCVSECLFHSENTTRLFKLVRHTCSVKIIHYFKWSVKLLSFI